MTKEIKIGKIKIGAGNPIAVQSMTNTQTKNIDATISQIHRLEDAGCEIIRVAVPDKDSAIALKKLKENISIPLVADIHFDYRLAIESAKYADKIRINPGNIQKEKIKDIIKECKNYNIPIRVGINLGSLEKDIEKKFGLNATALVESALRNIRILEDNDFYNIVVSVKASDVNNTIGAYRMLSKRTEYPLHIGISEAGTLFSGTIKSAVGIGILLTEGIGETIRVSLSADPIKEVKVAWEILKSLGLRKRGVSVTSCPMCARANFDVEKITREIEDKTSNIKKPLHIAIMGCGVNGPGEAKMADIGVVGGKANCVLYANKGKVKTIKKDDIINSVMGLVG